MKFDVVGIEHENAETNAVISLLKWQGLLGDVDYNLSYVLSKTNGTGSVVVETSPNRFGQSEQHAFIGFFQLYKFLEEKGYFYA